MFGKHSGIISPRAAAIPAPDHITMTPVSQRRELRKDSRFAETDGGQDEQVNESATRTWDTGCAWPALRDFREIEP